VLALVWLVLMAVRKGIYNVFICQPKTYEVGICCFSAPKMITSSIRETQIFNKQVPYVPLDYRKKWVFECRGKTV